MFDQIQTIRIIILLLINRQIPTSVANINETELSKWKFSISIKIKIVEYSS